MPAQMTLTARMVGMAGALGIALLVAGCGSFAFYEDTKVGITIKVDPKAPEPVEITASFKEAVFALVPVREPSDASGPTTVEVGEVLSDFDVRFGANAGLPLGAGRDFLYVVVTHGLASGQAATTLASGAARAEASRREAVASALQKLSDGALAETLRRLGIAGVEATGAARLREGLLAAVATAGDRDLAAVERAAAEQASPAR